MGTAGWGGSRAADLSSESQAARTKGRGTERGDRQEAQRVLRKGIERGWRGAREGPAIKAGLSRAAMERWMLV